MEDGRDAPMRILTGRNKSLIHVLARLFIVFDVLDLLFSCMTVSKMGVSRNSFLDELWTTSLGRLEKYPVSDTISFIVLFRHHFALCCLTNILVRDCMTVCIFNVVI